MDTGGWPWDLQSTMPNVEDNEWFYPILYLWRKELANSGGAGKYRGGNSGELAFIPTAPTKFRCSPPRVTARCLGQVTAVYLRPQHASA